MRVLAPVIVILVFGIVLFRLAGNPERAWERERIAATWDVAAVRPEADRKAFLERVARFVDAAGGDAESRWFAARAYVKADAVVRAIDSVWGSADPGEVPGTARRFGALLLKNLGFLDDENLRGPLSAAGVVALALVEGGDPRAAVFLDRFVTEDLEGGLLDYLYGAFLFATRETAERVARDLRLRGEQPADVVAALISMGPDPYPERDADLALLAEVVQEEGLRWAEKSVWARACIALGRSEVPEALEVLEGLRERLGSSPEPEDRWDGAVVTAGLVAGGRWDVADTLTPYLDLSGPESRVRVWTSEALLHRLRQGDPQAPERLRTLWESLQTVPDVALRAQVATALLLRDEIPPPTFPVEEILADLQAPSAAPVEHAIAAAFRFRRGEPGARSRLVEVARMLARRGWVAADRSMTNPRFVSPLITVCRAFFFYDDSSAP